MEFETTLRAHYRQEGETRGSTAWYALRNTVFASGCRIALSKDASKSFSEIESEAWGYFANAFSVYTELMFTFSGLLAVRALIAMVRLQPNSINVADEQHSLFSQKDSAAPPFSTCYAQMPLEWLTQKVFIDSLQSPGTSLKMKLYNTIGYSGLYIAVRKISHNAQAAHLSV